MPQEKDENVVPTNTTPQDNSASQGQQGSTGDNNSQNKGSEQESQAKGSEGSQSEQSTGQDQNKNQEEQGGDKNIDQLLNQFSELQKQVSSINNRIPESNSEGKKEETPDFEAQLSELDQKMANGDLTMDQYLKQQRAINDQRVQQQASQIVEQKLGEKEVDEATQKFLSDNPDFQEVSQTKEFQQFMQQNPVYDVAGAYEKFKRQQDQSKIQELEQQIQTLKQQQEEAVKNGAKVTDTVGKESGAEAKEGVKTTEDNLTGDDALMAALQKYQQAQGD